MVLILSAQKGMFTVWETNLHEGSPIPSHLHTYKLVCLLSEQPFLRSCLKLLTGVIFQSFNSNVI